MILSATVVALFMETGYVDYFDKTSGYGFIKTDAVNENVFFHMAEVGNEDPVEGDGVEFDWISTDEGPRVTVFRLLEENRSSDGHASSLEQPQIDPAITTLSRPVESFGIIEYESLPTFVEGELMSDDVNNAKHVVVGLYEGDEGEGWRLASGMSVPGIPDKNMAPKTTDGRETDHFIKDAGASIRTQCRDAYLSEMHIPDSVPAPPVERLSLSHGDIQERDFIGKGGNAYVVSATVPTDDGDFDIALKKPRMSGSQTFHPEVSERMLNEAEKWQQLDDHDHIVGVVDYGSNPFPWIAMEYMDGGHLGERMGGMNFPQKLWTAIAVTEGVLHAHRGGIAHRDLKPENILFRKVEEAWDVPKVADWELSKHLLEQSKSRDGITIEYAAPEQFSDDAPTDDRTDVYQLGAVFYELFTDQPPFEGDTFTVMDQIKTEKPTPPSELADVPAELDEVILQALAKERGQRPDHVVLLRNELQKVLESIKSPESFRRQ